MQKLPQKGLQFLADVINEDFTVSFITYIEFLGYHAATQSTEEFIALANVIGINKTIIDTCIVLRKEHRIKLPDAIIAATALVNGMDLVSHNRSDFKNIQDLNVIDPWNLKVK